MFLTKSLVIWFAFVVVTAFTVPKVIGDLVG